MDTSDTRKGRWLRAPWSTIPFLALGIGILGFGKDAEQEFSIDPGDWPHYGRDLAASKYSPLDQVSAANVDQLEIAWIWQSADYDLLIRNPGLYINPNYQVTPIKIGDRLYTTTNMGQAVALDPETGIEQWRYDPYAEGLRDRPTGRTNRGVAYWSDVTNDRVFLGSGQYLVALDAATGSVLEGFGEGGVIDLAGDLGIPVSEDDLTTFQAETADEAFMTSTSLCLCPARSYNGKILGDGTVPGPVTTQLMNAFSELVGYDFVGQYMRKLNSP